ncbi:hypothetical protein FH609_020235 [Streptomyces sp. 3MP-14]|uniref:Cysteine-rich CPCC domain-containing protein n=2 Tax=Streptomyces TaxID=1883 RepID=A0A5N6A1Q5_9ACTN|nr:MULTISPECIES: CPCC family cysteine-rich protein [Streptomyces]KAB8161816.1 hypothetical protein FH607_024185 [Streptomyces mimosae]KAB8174916.1 hypothetical protein FH609_020235 [Streptomyces sp. 3MP-14]
MCFWEDDDQDDHDASRVRGGPNGRLSLGQARSNFHAIGACDERRGTTGSGADSHGVPASATGTATGVAVEGPAHQMRTRSGGKQRSTEGSSVIPCSCQSACSHRSG